MLNEAKKNAISVFQRCEHTMPQLPLLEVTQHGRQPCVFLLFFHFSCAERCQVKPFSVFLFGKRKEPLLIECGRTEWCGMSFAQ